MRGLEDVPMISRRTAIVCLAGFTALLSATMPGLGQTTRTVVDDAGRRVELPMQVKRVLTAGPPASVLLYTLAPEAMVGWVRALTPEETPFLAAPYRDLPAHGRLTGRGNTPNVESVLALKPYLILAYVEELGRHVCTPSLSRAPRDGRL